MSANLNIELYKKAYFYFDKPVEYQLKDKKIIYIYPIIVKDSEIFLSSVSVISIDKNSSDSVEIIQMSYLDFIYKILFQDEINISRFINILRYCLHIENPEIGYDENQKPFLKDKDTDIVIKSKDFDNIRKLILYQNLVHYDDEYINPDLKEAIEGTNRLRNKNIEMPTIERKCAIITAHCGLSKKEQLEMTMRSHSMLFDEIYGEIEFTTTRPIFLYAGKGKDIDHWIYRKKRNKLDGYITEKSTLVQQMGGNNNFVDTSVNTSRGDSLEQLYKQGGQ
jgi:hypothetical protein